ncbi:hypothetical protein C8R48DRAFT_250811 [Suillus tomentosus]|nr:hypothetical protein C8R48DRAFT_250811 [Suillus tomentosus]
MLCCGCIGRVVTACFCSWGRHSGYIQIPVRDVVDGGFDVLNGERYFGTVKPPSSWFFLIGIFIAMALNVALISLSRLLKESVQLI